MALRTNDLELVPITLFAYTEAQRRKGMITLRNSFFGVAVVLFGYGVVLFLKAGSDSPWFLTMFCGFFLLFLGVKFIRMIPSEDHILNFPSIADKIETSVPPSHRRYLFFLKGDKYGLYDVRYNRVLAPALYDGICWKNKGSVFQVEYGDKTEVLLVKDLVNNPEINYVEPPSANEETLKKDEPKETGNRAAFEINPKREIIPEEGNVLRNPQAPVIVKKNTGWIVFLLLLLLASGGTAFYFYNENVNDQAYWEDRIRSSESDLSIIKDEVSALKDKVSVLKDENETLIQYALPIVVNSIQIGNVDNDGNIDTDYGERIYDYDTMFLKPRISYYGVTKIGSSITLYSKLFKNGVLSTGTSSPSGYSSSFTLTVNRGSNIAYGTGWGNKTRGHWSSGQYRYELWYNDMCLKALDFTIY